MNPGRTYPPILEFEDMNCQNSVDSQSFDQFSRDQVFDERPPTVEEMTDELWDEFLEYVIWDVCLDVHRAAKMGYLSLEDDSSLANFQNKVECLCCGKYFQDSAGSSNSRQSFNTHFKECLAKYREKAAKAALQVSGQTDRGNIIDGGKSESEKYHSANAFFPDMTPEAWEKLSKTNCAAVCKSNKFKLCVGPLTCRHHNEKDRIAAKEMLEEHLKAKKAYEAKKAVEEAYRSLDELDLQRENSNSFPGSPMI